MIAMTRMRMPRLTALRGAIAAIADTCQRNRAELLVSVAIFGGWAFLTLGIAALTTPFVWAISAGLLLLSLAGWQFLGSFAWRGLYVIAQKEKNRRG